MTRTTPQTAANMVEALEASIAAAKKSQAEARRALRVAKKCARLVNKFLKVTR